MRIYDYEEAFGAWDLTTAPMRRAMEQWLELYYEKSPGENQDPCQRIAYTVVNKLVRTIFGEYKASCQDPAAAQLIEKLDGIRKEAMQQTLVEGECYIKPCIGADGFSFALVPRTNMLIFNRDRNGMPTDVGTVEKSVRGKFYYTLLERRQLDEAGRLTIGYSLYRSPRSDQLGSQVSLQVHPGYCELAEQYRYEKPLGSLGLIRLKTPILNCVDGSPDGVAIYAAAAGLIHNIDWNEAQMNGEFQRGESRIITSADLLGKDGLTDHLFVGLDEDPEQVGMTIFSPNLREQSFLARKREYLRNVESVIGLKRGMLSDANADKWTATEVSSSAGDYNLTVIDFQSVWEEGLQNAVALCRKLAEIYQLPPIGPEPVTVDWGNGTLYDEDKIWQDYKDMTGMGLIRPEIALGWRFRMPCDTPEQQQRIREDLMPENKTL